LDTSLLFIPDISGFTEFVNQTEVNHSQHIISELLEIVIDANDLSMKVSEIEGDAVIFYREGAVPVLEKIVEQAEKMFLLFHNHLKYYESRRVCDCGACSTAHNLSLKFICHAGTLGFTQIKKKSKPFGPALVKAHKLLKNSIVGDEYILFSDYFDSEISFLKKTYPFERGSGSYEKLGMVEYNYISLTYLLDQLDSIPPPEKPKKVSKPISKQIIIDQKIEIVFEVMTNLELRSLWNKSPKELQYERGKVNRVGTRHTCIFPVDSLEVETIKADKDNYDKAFAEKAQNFKMGKTLILFYYIKELSAEQVLVEFQIHIEPYPIIGGLLKQLILPSLKKQFAQSAQTFKEVCESINDDEPLSKLSEA